MGPVSTVKYNKNVLKSYGWSGKALTHLQRWLTI